MMLRSPILAGISCILASVLCVWRDIIVLVVLTPNKDVDDADSQNSKWWTETESVNNFYRNRWRLDFSGCRTFSTCRLRYATDDMAWRLPISERKIELKQPVSGDLGHVVSSVP